MNRPTEASRRREEAVRAARRASPASSSPSASFTAAAGGGSSARNDPSASGGGGAARRRRQSLARSRGGSTANEEESNKDRSNSLRAVSLSSYTKINHLRPTYASSSSSRTPLVPLQRNVLTRSTPRRVPEDLPKGDTGARRRRRRRLSAPVRPLSSGTRTPPPPASAGGEKTTTWKTPRFVTVVQTAQGDDLFSPLSSSSSGGASSAAVRSESDRPSTHNRQSPSSSRRRCSFCSSRCSKEEEDGPGQRSPVQLPPTTTTGMASRGGTPPLAPRRRSSASSPSWRTSLGTAQHHHLSTPATKQSGKPLDTTLSFFTARQEQTKSPFKLADASPIQHLAEQEGEDEEVPLCVEIGEQGGGGKEEEQQQTAERPAKETDVETPREQPTEQPTFYGTPRFEFDENDLSAAYEREVRDAQSYSSNDDGDEGNNKKVSLREECPLLTEALEEFQSEHDFLDWRNELLSSSPEEGGGTRHGSRRLDASLLRLPTPREDSVTGDETGTAPPSDETPVTKRELVAEQPRRTSASSSWTDPSHSTESGYQRDDDGDLFDWRNDTPPEIHTRKTRSRLTVTSLEEPASDQESLPEEDVDRGKVQQKDLDILDWRNDPDTSPDVPYHRSRSRIDVRSLLEEEEPQSSAGEQSLKSSTEKSESTSMTGEEIVEDGPLDWRKDASPETPPRRLRSRRSSSLILSGKVGEGSPRIVGVTNRSYGSVDDVGESPGKTPHHAKGNDEKEDGDDEDRSTAEEDKANKKAVVVGIPVASTAEPPLFGTSTTAKPAPALTTGPNETTQHLSSIPEHDDGISAEERVVLNRLFPKRNAYDDRIAPFRDLFEEVRKLRELNAKLVAQNTQLVREKEEVNQIVATLQTKMMAAVNMAVEKSEALQSKLSDSEQKVQDLELKLSERDDFIRELEGALKGQPLDPTSLA